MATRPIDAAGVGRPGRGIAGTLVALTIAAAIIGLGPRIAEAVIGALGITGAASAEAMFTLLVFGALGSAAAVGGAATGFKPWAWVQRSGMMSWIGAATGFGAFGLAVACASLAGTLGKGSAALPGAGLWLAGVIVVLFQVVAEEWYFRGWVQPMLARGVGMLPAVLATGVAFGLLHAIGGAASAVALLNMMLGGVLFGLLAARGQGVAGAIGAHGAWNLTEQLGVGLDPNPGIGSFGALTDWDLSGAAAWGGSADGLNASWAMLFALLATSVTALLLPWRQQQR